MTVTAAEEERLAPARAAFELWATQQPGRPRDSGALIRQVETSDQYAGLLATDIQGRRVVWKAVPFAGKARVTFPPIAPEAVDPWNADAVRLREQSEHIAICDACNGNGKVECRECSGGAITCGECNGQRKMYGYASNGSRRLLNCQSCRGKGQVDCANCRRGIAVCSTCAGERRVQKWIELQWWQRSTTCTRPERIAQQFGWADHPSTAAIERDASLVCDIERPARLTPGDIDRIPPEWLIQLAPPLEPGERVVRQRLRIARIPSFTVHYALGNDADCITFTGRRMLQTGVHSANAFTRRAWRLRSLQILLFAAFLVAMFLSLVRGTYYWSILTLASLAALAVSLVAMYMAAAGRMLRRKRWRLWPAAAAIFLAAALATAYAALPTADRASRLLAAGRLDEAENELRALGDDAPRASVDRLTIARALEHAKANQLDEGAALLERVNRGVPAAPDLAAAAAAVYLPLARQRISRTDWPGAAGAIEKARALGVAESELGKICESIHSAAKQTASEARDEIDSSRRLRLRLAAEETFIAWETATGQWGTSELIALRTQMARDLALTERRSRR